MNSNVGNVMPITVNTLGTTTLVSRSALLMCLLISGFMIFGQFLSIPVWILLLSVITLSIAVYSLKEEMLSVAVFIATVTAVQFKSDHGVFTMMDAMAGAVISIILFSFYFKTLLFPQRYSMRSTTYRFFLFYFIWVAVIGVGNIIFYNSLAEHWFREILILTPLLLVPPLLSVMASREEKWMRFLELIIILRWLLIFVMGVVKVRSSSLVATYLFEVGFARFDIINGAFMLMVFYCLYLSEEKKKIQYYYIIGMLTSIGSLILAFNRTMWVLSAICIVVLPLFIGSIERRKAYRFLFKSLFILALSLTLLYFIFPLFRMVAQYLTSHLMSSSHLGTDPSLVNRYVEWRYVLKAIAESPVVGYGLGSKYHLYGWIVGVSTETGYTHNAYLGVLHRGGIIGFTLIFGAYFGFIAKGFSMLRNRILHNKERAIVRAGLALLIMLLVAMNTLNIFSHRDVLLYVGLIWGYFLYIERFREKREIVTK